jgi:hypothetical protein
MCDVVDSTALAQSLDPEDLHDVLAGYQRVGSDAVKRHDGHIAQYLGDGVLIYFGFPLAHEDDASRAVRCGLEILSGMDQLPRPADARLRVRVAPELALAEPAAVPRRRARDDGGLVRPVRPLRHPRGAALPVLGIAAPGRRTSDRRRTLMPATDCEALDGRLEGAR